MSLFSSDFGACLSWCPAAAIAGGIVAALIDRRAQMMPEMISRVFMVSSESSANNERSSSSGKVNVKLL